MNRGPVKITRASVLLTPVLASLCFGLGGMQSASAQAPDSISPETPASVGGELDGAAAALEHLDELALQCQPALAQDEPGVACRRFLTAMHGEQFLDYTSHCTRIRNWRDGQIESRLEAGTDADDSEDAQTLLENLMRAEYLCGQDALSKRSVAIVPVYRALDGGSADGHSLLTLLQDLRFRQMDQQRRWQDEQVGQTVRQQQRQMTDELFRRQQQELLRQEIERQSLHQENWRN